MIVGVLRVRLTIFEALSLKDKRRVVKSLKDRLAHRYNISIAEVDDLDRRQVATLGIAVVGNEARFVESQCDTILNEVRRYPHASLIEHDLELL